MKSELKKIDSTNVEITVKLGEEQLKKAKDAALKRMQPEASAPGFRKGKVPLNIVEKQADANYLQTQAADEALNVAYLNLVEEHDLQPVKQPSVDIKTFVPYSNLEAVFQLEVIPELKLADYKNLKVEKPEAKVTEADVNDVIDNLKKRMAERKDVERAAKDGDEVTINFEGKDSNGKAVAGASGNDYPLVLGSDTFIPGFEKNIVGLKKGDTKTFTIKFPKDYAHKPLAEQNVEFSVEVKKVSEIIEPKVDDEFAAKVGPFKTVDELMKDVRSQLETQKQQEAQSEYRDKLIEKIVSDSKLELPQSLLDEQVESLFVEFKQNLIYRGMTLEEYLKQSSLSEEEFKQKELLPQAEKRVSAGLVLSEIAKAENIEVTPEELEIRLQLMKGQHQNDEQMKAQLETDQAKREVMSRLMSEKTLAKLEELNK